MFCPKCGSILVPRKEGRKRILVCSCGFRQKTEKSLTIKEISNNKKENNKKEGG